MKKYLKTNYVWIVTPIFVLVFFVLFTGIKPFGDRSLVNHDAFQQIYPALCELSIKLKKGESLFYSWSNRMGAGFLPVYFFHISNPVNLLVVFMDRREILTFMDWFCAIRIALSSGTFAYVLSKYNEKKIEELTETDENEDDISIFKNRRVLICALAVAYAFSAFICGYYYQMMWLDSYVMFPIIMYGYRRMISEKKPLVYIISLAISAYLNFYMIYMIALFLILVFLLDKHYSIKDLLKKGLLFAVSSLFSVGLSALPILVCFFGTRNLYSSQDSIPQFGFFGNIFYVIRKMFILADSVIVSYNNYDSNIYCGLFALVFFVFYLSSDIPIAEKIKRTFLVVLLLLSMDERILNYIWHGFHNQIGVPNRFSFLLIYVLLYSSFEGVNKIKNRKALIPGLLLVGMLPLVSYIFVDFASEFSSSIIIYGTMVLVLMYSAIALLALNRNNRLIFAILSVLMIFESCINIYFTFDKDNLDIESFMSAVEGPEDIIDQVESKRNIKSKYRSGVFAYSGYPNKCSFYDIAGLEGFSSFIGDDISGFSSRFGFSGMDNGIQDLGNTQIIENIMGVRYYYVYNGEQIIQSDSSLEKIYDDGMYSVYQNPNALPLIFAADEGIKQVGGWKEHDMIANINDLASRMIPCDDLITEVNPEYTLDSYACNLSYADSDYLHLKCVPTSDNESWQTLVEFDVEAGSYNLCLESVQTCSVSVYKNNEIVIDNEDLWYYGIFNIGNIETGDKISVVLSEPEDRNAILDRNIGNEIAVRVAKIDSNLLGEFCAKGINDGIDIKENKTDYIKGEIELEDNQIILTSIPYDEGWRVYVDGQSTRTVKCADAFIGVECGPGKHLVELQYVPKGFVPGAIISMLSTILLIIICIYIKMDKIKVLKNVK